MQIGITTRLWNYKLVRAMDAKGITLEAMCGLAPMSLTFILALRTLKFRWSHDDVRKSAQENTIIRVASLLDLSLDDVYPDWFAELPAMPTTFKTMRDVDRLQLTASVERLCLPVSTSPVYELEKKEALQSLREGFRTLTFRQRQVMRLRGEGLTLEEVGRAAKITRERVRQIEAKAIRKLGQFACTTKGVPMCEYMDTNR